MHLCVILVLIEKKSVIAPNAVHPFLAADIRSSNGALCMLVFWGLETSPFTASGHFAVNLNQEYPGFQH